MSLAEIAYFGWLFASLTLLRKVEEGPQLLVVFVVVVVAAVVGFAAKEVYYKCLQHKLQVAH